MRERACVGKLNRGCANALLTISRDDVAVGWTGNCSVAENAFLFYGLLASFVLGSLGRNKRMGRPHIPQLVAMGWMLFAVSLSGAAWLSVQALDMAMSA